MTLPVASYEELLAYMRGFRKEIQCITSSVSEHPELGSSQSLDFNDNVARRHYATHPQRRATMSDETVSIIRQK